MNYFDELNLFWRSGITSYLTANASLLYLAILDIANQAHWPDTVAIPTTLLKARTGIEDRRDFHDARNRLKQIGLIDCDSKQGSSKCYYTIKGTAEALQTLYGQKKGPISPPDTQEDTGSIELSSFQGASGVNFSDTQRDSKRDSHGNSDEGTQERIQTGIWKDTQGDTRKDAESIELSSLQGIPGINFSDTQGDSDRDTQGDTRSRKPAPDKASRVPQTKLNETDNSTSLRSLLRRDRRDDASRVFDDSKITNRDLIAELVARYRAIPNVAPAKGDYPFLGRLYNNHGYDQVLIALDKLEAAMAYQEIKKPLVYLAGILTKGPPQHGKVVDFVSKLPDARELFGGVKA